MTVLPRKTEVIWRLPKQRISRWSLLCNTALALGTVGLFVLTVGVGKVSLTFAEFFDVVTGGGSRLERTIVFEWRLPRAIVGCVIGGMLGIGGAISQTLTRNPLASPDILGITMGASTGGVVALAFISVEPVVVTISAFAGALIIAVFLAAVSWRGEFQDLRLILAGIGLNSFCAAVITAIFLRVDLEKAASLMRWLSGSLDGMGYREVTIVAIMVLIFVVATAPVLWNLAVLSLGQAMAFSLGVPKLRVTINLWIGAVLLAAGAVAVAGPIGFIAFGAPQVARVLYREAIPPVFGSALVGGFILSAADFVARMMLDGAFPVGLITTALGAPFFLVILIAAARKVTVK